MVELGNYIDILSGYAFDSKLFNDKGKGIPLIRIRDVGKDASKTFYLGNYDEKYVLNNGDFLIGMDGDFRLAEWNGGKALLNQRVCKIWSKDKSKLDEGYLLRLLPKELKLIEDTTSFATVKHLSVKKINNIQFPLPPLETQKKIAAILDEADKLRQLDKQLIEKYDALTQSLFLEMFGDFVLNPNNFKQITIGELCPEKYSIVCGPFGTQLKIGEYVEDGIPVYGIDNVDVNNFIDAKPKYITDSKYIQLKAFIVKHNDILITRTGTVGRTCLAPNIDKAVIGPNLLKIRIQNNEVDPVYLAFAFNYSPSIKKQIKMFSPGATVAVYNTGNLKKLKVLVPPISLQNQFKETFHVIESQKAQAQQSLEKSEELFNSLLQKAFKGELT